MHSGQHPWKPDEGDCPPKTLVCDECGIAFQKPIFATVSVSGRTQTYYACPRCMAKVSNVKASTGEEEKKPVLSAEDKRLTAEPEVAVKCPHFFGYLRKHQKNTPFPDECLTCLRMVECMLLN
jgi:hypothetical protein